MLVADSEEKLCTLLSEFGRICEIKWRLNKGKSKVMRCLRYVKYVNVGRMDGEDRFRYQGSQVAADGGCERDVEHGMNEDIKRGKWRKVS